MKIMFHDAVKLSLIFKYVLDCILSSCILLCTFHPQHKFQTIYTNFGARMIQKILKDSS